MGSGKCFKIGKFIICTVHLRSRMMKSERLRWAGLVVRMEEGKSAFKILTVKPSGKRSTIGLRHTGGQH